MSFARGDLARRAALADNLAVPEPWSSNDDPRVFAAIRDLKDEFRRLGITDEDGKGRLPDFLLDYENLPPIKPTALGRAHRRNSSATRWDQNGNLVEEPSDTLRLQRDPKTQEPLGLLYEPQRTQLLGSPTDLPSGKNYSVNNNVASKKELDGDGMIEDNTSDDSQHQLSKTISPGTDNPVAASWIVEANGRDYAYLKIAESGGDRASATFDLQNGTKTDDLTFGIGSVIEYSIDDLGDGVYRLGIAASPSAGSEFTRVVFQISAGPSSVNPNDYKYNGNGSDGLISYHRQVEVSREVTTPILTGSATRGADEVNYDFSFPDKTTGVAYSIEQQGGGLLGGGFDYESINRNVPGINLGTTASNDKFHGVLMYEQGLNSETNDGKILVTRNSDERDSDGNLPDDDTIDRFELQYNNISFTVRQIAIHRQPHTAAQKDTLRDQYLTQP